MTAPDQNARRPVPDTGDLRLLNELINHGSIPLAQAAWNARMSQAEAAARLVTMAETGLPLRLVAEGDQAMLWRIAQAGPATGSSGQQLLPPAQQVQHPVQPAPLPATLAPAAVPPHEQAIAGAVPLGQPPFGSPTASGRHSAVTDESQDDRADSRRTQQVTGLSGEALSVTLLEVVDPADAVVVGVGYRLDPGERAVLVHTALANIGTVAYQSLPDQYLVLESGSGALLPKAPMALPSHPSYPMGVAPGSQVEGWTVFLIPADTMVAGVRWSVRPDLADRSLSWTVRTRPAAPPALSPDLPGTRW